MPKINIELQQTLTERMSDTFDLIVRTDGDASPHLRWLAAEGIEVKRQFRLTPGLAVSCTGQDALRLLEADWVISVELDAPVRAL
jgi:hypothetical protein